MYMIFVRSFFFVTVYTPYSQPWLRKNAILVQGSCILHIPRKILQGSYKERNLSKNLARFFQVTQGTCIILQDLVKFL